MSKESLYSKLIEYSKNGRYPLHMPGHKRQRKLFDFNKAFVGDEDFFNKLVDKPFDNSVNELNEDKEISVYVNNQYDPFDIDITEINGFDDLHHPEGIIKAAMENASDFFGTRATFFLVNGSSCGILSAITAVTNIGDTIILGRNCHKSAYNAVQLRNLNVEYVYPEIVEGFNISGGYKPEEIEQKFVEAEKKNIKVKAVVITSPTYEGIVSDIKKIAEIVHGHNSILIVDEAHGAHFVFDKYFPDSATKQGADLVIQSTHKTLPSFTQTAVLHLCSDLIKKEQVEEMIDIYETSSPSYLLMASAEYGIMYMKEEKGQLAQYVDNLKIFRKKCEQLQKIELLDQKKLGCFAYDNGKLVFSVKNCGINGKELFYLLYDKYHIELEMENLTYGIAMTSVCDTKENFEKLWVAISEIDKMCDFREKQNELEKEIQTEHLIKENFVTKNLEFVYPPKMMESWQCRGGQVENIKLSDAVGRISGKYVMIYPPGVPILVPGEKILKETVENISQYLYNGYNVLGLFKEDRVQVLLKGDFIR